MSWKDWVQGGHQLFSWATVWKEASEMGIDWIWPVEIECRLDMGCIDGYCERLSCSDRIMVLSWAVKIWY